MSDASDNRLDRLFWTLEQSLVHVALIKKFVTVNRFLFFNLSKIKNDDAFFFLLVWKQ